MMGAITADEVDIPNLDLLSVLFDSPYCRAKEDTPLHSEASRPDDFITKNTARDILQQISWWLREQYGIGKDGPARDIVVSYCNGSSSLPCFFYGVVAAGGIYSAAVTHLSAAQLAWQIQHGPAKLLVCTEDMHDVAIEAAKLANFDKRRVLVLKSGVDCRCGLIAADGSAEWTYGQGQGRLKWMQVTDREKLENTAICLVYTSGTTGIPKGVKISHANMVAEAVLPAAVNRPIWDKWATEGSPFEPRILAHLSVGHISGLQSYMVNPFYDGGVVYWMPRFDFKELIGYTASLKITYMYSLPRVYAAIAAHPLVTDQFKTVKIAYSGGLPLDPRVYNSTKFGGVDARRTLLSQTWGATETTGAATHVPTSKRDTSGSVGMVFPNMALRLTDDDGNDIQPGQPGEAWLKGPIIATGYHDNDTANNVSFRDGWYRTGDVIQIKDGLIYVLGRKSDAITSDGNSVYPAELEQIIMQYSGVADAGVTSLLSDGVELPLALVTLGPGIERSESLADSLAGFVNGRVETHKHLRGGIRFVDDIPRSLSGKLLRDDLKRMCISQ